MTIRLGGSRDTDETRVSEFEKSWAERVGPGVVDVVKTKSGIENG